MLVKIKFKGYAFELKKNDPTRCNENKERIKKQQKSKSKQIA
ncbi:hypothetical protein [Helicobacter pylori]|nr:hypothetical protein [Helicobacter pylori]